jgi:hypothetical protein
MVCRYPKLKCLAFIKDAGRTYTMQIAHTHWSWGDQIQYKMIIPVPILLLSVHLIHMELAGFSSLFSER